MDRVPPKSPLKRGLFVQRPLSNWILFFLDFILGLRKKEIPVFKKPQKILLCNIANFGDLIASTAVLPAIKKKYPECEIGFLASSLSGKTVFQNFPSFSKVHFFDHWYLNRSLGICKAVLQHWISRRNAIKEIKKAKYDLAIDLHPYFPNAIPLLANSQIPIRIGYGTGGFSSLLTHPAKWDFADRYVGYSHLHLLEILGIDAVHESPLPSYRTENLDCTRSQKRCAVEALGVHVVVHMGSSSTLKEWEIEKWIELIERLETVGWKVVLTGKGQRELKLCEKVAAQTNSLNLCNQLSWVDFVRTIQEAQLVITVDSVAVHLAAGSLTPTLVLFSGINSPHMWLPPSPFCKGLMKSVACAPCFNKKGCSSMACIKGIEVEDIYRTAMEMVCRKQM